MAKKLPETRYDLNVKALLDIVSTGRPWGGDNESALAEKWLDPIPGCVVDMEGNRIISVGDEYNHAFSCHLDTVHPKDTHHKLALVSDTHTIFNYDGGILGADDGAGVWTMLMLLKHGVPGLYLFHVGEEKGGIGSSHIADNNPQLLKPIDMILAFDRRGTKDIITSQAGGRCCSDAWAKALANQLDMGHEFASGTFTDTANYTSIVPECSNISVGYENEHSKYETLDVGYLMRLVDNLIDVNWKELPIERDPKDIEYDPWDGYYGSYAYGYRDRYRYNSAKNNVEKSKSKSVDPYSDIINGSDSTGGTKVLPSRTRVEHLALIAELVEYEPEAVADVIYTKYGFDYDDFLWDVVQSDKCEFDWGDHGPKNKRVAK